MASREKFDLVISAKDQSKGVLNSIKGEILAVGSAYLSWEIGKEIIVESTKAAAKYEATLKSLDAVSVATGRDMNKVYAEMRNQMGGLASDANIASGFLKGMTTTLDVEQISDMTTAIKDASIAMGEDFNTQLPLIIKAVKQLNPAILDNIGVTVRLDEVNKRIRDGYYGYGQAVNEATQQNAIFQEIMKQTAIFQGQEAVFLETTAGKWSKLRTEVENAQTAYGNFIINSDLVQDSLDGSAESLSNFTKFMKSDLKWFQFFSIAFRKYQASTQFNVGSTKQLNEELDKYIKLQLRLNGVIKDGVVDIDNYSEEVKDLVTRVNSWRDEIPDGWFPNAVNDEDLSGIRSLIESTKELEGIAKSFVSNARPIIPGLLFDSDEDIESELNEIVTFVGVVNSNLLRMTSSTRARQTAVNNQFFEDYSHGYATTNDVVLEFQEEYSVKSYERQGLLYENLFSLKTNYDSSLILSDLELAQLRYDEQVLQNELEHELTANKLAVELGLTRDQLDGLIDLYRDKFDQVQTYISTYARRISGEFRSSIHQMVRDSDSGALVMRDVWKNLGKSIRSVLIDMVLDGIFAVIAGIGRKITAMAAEEIAVSALTSQYIALAAAQALFNPVAGGAGIAASNAVLGQGAVIKGLAGFDDPINDAVAFRHGRDYASEFMAGQQEIFSAPNFGNAMVALQPEQGFAGGSSITININGDNYDTDAMVSRIEDSIRNGLSSLSLSDNDTITGTQDARFA